MGKHRNNDRYRGQYGERRDNSYDPELNFIRKQQHQIAQNNTERYRKQQLKMNIVVLLENGTSLNGTVMMFNNPNMPKCKILFNDNDRRRLNIDMDIDIQVFDPEKIAVLQATINNQLMALHEEAIMEFPEWLEKHSTRIDENNPFFNLDEIREEFKYKKFRFGAWRIAAQMEFFDNQRPQFAKFNKIIRLELREIES